MKYDLAFGNSVAVRKAFLEIYKGPFIILTHDTLEAFDYPVNLGDPELIEITRKIIKRQIGQNYKYIIITNGATGAINIALNAYKQNGIDSCITREAPYYMRYPSMIEATGLYLVDFLKYKSWNPVVLLDVPSNPLNLTNHIFDDELPTILDGVYLNKVYTNGNIKIPKHETYIASYSKLTGLNGLRIGFLCTNDKELYELFAKQTIASYCGLSKADSLMAIQMLHGFDWETFEIKAKYKLDANREEISKLEKFMGDRPVQDMGMFYYSNMDKNCQKLFKKAGIIWTKGSDIGTADDCGRLNIGQDCKIIQDAVKSVLKNDRK